MTAPSRGAGRAQALGMDRHGSHRLAMPANMQRHYRGAHGRLIASKVETAQGTFRVVCYERGSIIVTFNLPFDEWTGVFESERLRQ